MMIGDIAEQIRQARKKRGWSQRRLAKEADVTEQTIVNIEKGHHGPAWGTLQKISEALEPKKTEDVAKEEGEEQTA